MSIIIDTSNFEKALGRMMSLSKRELPVVAKEQMRGVMHKIIAITPPGHTNENGIVTGAAARGRAKVLSNIRSLYGTPSQAYEELKAQDQGAAKHFWRELSQGKTHEAHLVLNRVTGKRLGEFDGGTLHQRFKKGRRWQGTRRPPVFYIPKKQPLDEYIKEIQKRVGWLASGWNEAAAELGITLPDWIWKHDGPGTAIIEETESIIRIVATNNVRYAAEAADMNRRIENAMRMQVGAMERRIQHAMEKISTMAGLTFTP